MNEGTKGRVTVTSFDAMLFDCDGVLVDSEPIVNRVLRDEIAQLGWDMTMEQCIDTFVGLSLEGVMARVQERTGEPVDGGWVQTFTLRRDEALRSDLEAVPGAPELVALAHETFGGRIACASNSERGKIRLQLGRAGLLVPFHERIFSAAETGPEKPSPAVYLAAAEAMEPPSSRFLVLEDSPPGVRAGKAAGGHVIGLASTTSREQLKAAGADTVVNALSEVTGLLLPRH